MNKIGKKEKFHDTIRNTFVKVMNERHHGNVRFKNKNEKRKDNPKRNWKSEWDD